MVNHMEQKMKHEMETAISGGLDSASKAIRTEHGTSNGTSNGIWEYR